MTRTVPCFRVCVWDVVRGRWRPRVIRTRNPDRMRAELTGGGLHPDSVLVELRPGNGVPMPRPDAPAPPRGVRLFAP